MALFKPCTDIVPSKIFKKSLGDLADLLGAEPNFTTITNFLIQEDLMSLPELKSIKSKSYDENQKGTEVAQLLLERLDMDDMKEAEERLMLICKIFEHKKVANEKLTRISAVMKEKLNPVSIPSKLF